MSLQRARLRLVAAALGLACAVASAAPADTALDRYLDGLRAWRASYTQTLTDARGRARGETQGVLLIQRPGKFRWESAPRGATATAQLMIADGRNLWFYDRDLEQVTVKPAARALSATPAALLSGAAPLREAFGVEAKGQRDGLEWVAVQPKSVDAEFRSARFGFAGLELRRLEIDDKLGQRAELRFARSERNGEVRADELAFATPAGVDVIGKPVQ